MLLLCFEYTLLCLDWFKRHFWEIFLYNGFFSPLLPLLFLEHASRTAGVVSALSPVPSFQSEFLANKGGSILNVTP